MTTNGRKALRFEIHTNWDDSWGSALMNGGALCDVLYVYGGNIPQQMDYHPGVFEPSLEEYPASIFDEMLTEGVIDLYDCEYWARVLSRYADLVPDNQRY